MKCAVIDVGSNSVRLLIISDGNIIFRDKNTTQLGEGMLDGVILPEPFLRTQTAVCEYIKIALGYGVLRENIYVFATAAVRQATNGKAFADSVFEKTNIAVDVISGEKEADIGLIGALNGKDGAVLDIGGASSELAIRSHGKTVYAVSLPVGAVKLYDAFHDERSALETYLSTVVMDYRAPKIAELTLIGGTASACAFILSGEKVFNVEKNHGRYVTSNELNSLADELFDLTPSERAEKYPIGEKRARIIACGTLLLVKILAYLKLDGATVSENDNLLGYYKLKTEALL